MQTTRRRKASHLILTFCRTFYRLDYIDLYLIHAPYGGTEGRLGAWKAMVEAVDAGKVKSIGVSNYGTQHLDELEQWQRVMMIEGTPSRLCTDRLSTATTRGQGGYPLREPSRASSVARPGRYSPVVRETRRRSRGILAPCESYSDGRSSSSTARQKVQQEKLADPPPMGPPKELCDSAKERNTQSYRGESLTVRLRALQRGHGEPEHG